ncbi:MAG: hypothetical protein M9939_01675 [Mesorhizobium sp.]|nr:hypothetical protein [Mesorhizobium sp.]MCO5159819.1 hypothetical protein [Mesorhizobium sp.]
MMTPETIILYDGVEQTIAEHALDYGIPSSRIIMRLVAGWSIEAAITRPVSIATSVEPRRKQDQTPSKGRKASLHTHAGRTMTRAEWAEHLGVDRTTIRHHLERHGNLDRVGMPSRTPLLVEFEGQSRTLKEWAEHFGVSIPALHDHLKRNGDFSKVGKPSVQAQVYTYQGVSRTLPEWAEAYGLKVNTLQVRLHRGWSLEKALTTPLSRARRR